jgi:hypothetical protein
MVVATLPPKIGRPTSRRDDQIRRQGPPPQSPTSNVQGPFDRKKDIDTKVLQLGYGNDPILKKFNLSVSTKMSEVKARILPAPKLRGGADMEGGPNFEPDRPGKWDLNGYRLQNVPPLPRGVLIVA